MINVVIYVSHWDTGGQGYKIKRAMDRHQPGFNVRSIHVGSAHFRYPQDLVYDPKTAYPLFASADVVHMRNSLAGLGKLLNQRSSGNNRLGLVLHYHGTRFRENHTELAAKASSMGVSSQLVSTIDLVDLEPGLQWLPAPFDLDEIASYRPIEPAIGHSRPIRICHAPTNRIVKSTDRIMEAIKNLTRSGYDVTFDLIERTTYDETLRQKAKADIIVDQLDLGIGNNALEAFGMGIPVIAGVSLPGVREAMLRRWGQLPFYEATSSNLEERLAHLIRNEELRREWGQIGLAHLTRYHEESLVASQLATLYVEAASTAGTLMEAV